MQPRILAAAKDELGNKTPRRAVAQRRRKRHTETEKIFLIWRVIPSSRFGRVAQLVHVAAAGDADVIVRHSVHQTPIKAAPMTPAESPNWCFTMGVSSESLKTCFATSATPSV